MTIVLLEGIEKLLVNDVEVVNNLRVGRGNIHIPVGSSISNNVTLKVVLLPRGLEGSSLIPLMNLPSKVGNIDTSIALTRDVKGVSQILGEVSVPVLESSEGILRYRHIILVLIFCGVSPGESNASRALNVKHVSSQVPWLRVCLNGVFSIVNNEGSVLLEESK